MEPVASGHAQTALEATSCASCGSDAEVGRSTPLCASCRSTLAARPFPRWLTVSAIVLVLPLAVAILRFPTALAASIAFERGHRAETAGAFDTAILQYSKVVDRFPTSTLAVA